MGVTAEDFRRLALALPETEERSHMDHPDFRVRGRIFATLDSPDEGWGMVNLPPEEQQRCVRADSETFVPAKGAWGEEGCTHVRLDRVDEGTLREAILSAWRKRAPKNLVEGAPVKEKPRGRTPKK